MVRTRTLALGAVGAAVAGIGAWNLYQRASAETVPYTVVARVDDVQLRRYPSLVTAETVADSEYEAFRRLFRYIDGDNESGEDVEMTTPVAVAQPEGELAAAPVAVAPGRPIPMTAPVETERRNGGVRMSFYLPPEYDIDSAPRPADDAVDLVVVPERTLAVSRFTWRPTESRVARETGRLLDTLAESGVPTAGEPFFMGYDAPGTLPFLRRNEVAVAVEDG